MLDAVVQVVREATGELHALVFHEVGGLDVQGLRQLVRIVRRCASASLLPASGLSTVVGLTPAFFVGSL